MVITADFHIHSCLSPCGDLAMSPQAIAAQLQQRGVTLAALTDHNSALNCPTFAYACKQYGIVPLFGIEAQPMEEVHVLCLFAQVETALAFGEELDAAMPFIPNNPEKMGDQIYVDEEENIIGEVEKYLIISAEMSLDDLAKRVIELGGIVIPAHVDRCAFSLTSQLGFIPDGPWAALEAVRLMPQSGQSDGSSFTVLDSKGCVIDTKNFPLITSSDSHYIEHIARRPFLLDIGDLPLVDEKGTVIMNTIQNALQKRGR